MNAINVIAGNRESSRPGIGAEAGSGGRIEMKMFIDRPAQMQQAAERAHALNRAKHLDRENWKATTVEGIPALVSPATAGERPQDYHLITLAEAVLALSKLGRRISSEVSPAPKPSSSLEAVPFPPASQWIIDYVSEGGFAGRSWYTREEDARRKLEDLAATGRAARLYRMTPQLVAEGG